MRDGVERVLEDLASSGSAAASVARLKLEMERMEWKHKAELAEQKRTSGGWTVRVGRSQAGYSTLSVVLNSISLRLWPGIANGWAGLTPNGALLMRQINSDYVGQRQTTSI